MPAQPYHQLRLWLLLIVSTVSAFIIAPDIQPYPSVLSSAKIVNPGIVASPLDQHQLQHQHLIAVDNNDNDDNDNDDRSNILAPRSITLPTPFDTSIGTNFTTKSCPRFFDSFLADSAVTNCHAMSLLLRNSYSFFSKLHSGDEAEGAVSDLLDVTCAADSGCADLLSSRADDLLKDEHCGKDYDLGNPLVVDAYLDLITYEPIHRASCLKNKPSGSPANTDDYYCFVNAVANASNPNPADYNVYFIPFGDPLKDADTEGNDADWDDAVPTCNQCLRASMDIFANWARRDGQPLANSYLPSAEVVNRHCGAGFANLNITVGTRKDVHDTSGGVGWDRSRPALSLLIGGGLAVMMLLI